MLHSGPFHTPPARPRGREASSEPLPWTAAARAGAGQVLRKKPPGTSAGAPRRCGLLPLGDTVLWPSELLSNLGARVNPKSSPVMRQGHFGQTSPTIWRFLEHPPHSPVAALLPVLFLSALPRGPRGWLPHPCSCLLRSHPRGVALPRCPLGPPSWSSHTHSRSPVQGGTQSSCGTTGRIRVLLSGPWGLERPGRCAP